ncbi:putative SOS response-associated peptidase YedK [compost metagenome]
MCGRYVAPDEAAMERFWHIGARNSGRWIRRVYNTAPTMQVPIVLLNEDGKQEVIPARWGLIPPWWKKPTPPALTFNARSEEAAVKPMWRQSLRFQRCLMPAMGWYEWNERQQVRSRSGRLVKQPYYHHAVGDEVMAIAGLWSTWTGPEGQDVVSCALLTKEAAPSISYVHHRMPVILHPEQFTLWLNPETKADQVLEAVALCREDFVAYPVSTEVGNTKNDYAELLEPVEVEP